MRASGTAPRVRATPTGMKMTAAQQQNTSGRMRRDRSNGIRVTDVPSRVQVLMLVVLLLCASYLSSCCCVAAYNYSPQINRQTIAGLWKLSPQRIPMKEFTVYDNHKESRVSQSRATGGDTGGAFSSNIDDDDDEEVLFMLREDGSFQQYEQQPTSSLLDEDDEDLDDDEAHDVDLDTSWQQFARSSPRARKVARDGNKQEKKQAIWRAVTKGIWDLRDGKLILAADRESSATQTTTTKSSSKKAETDAPSTNKQKSPQPPRPEDTLLVGRVVVSEHRSAASSSSTQQSSSTSDSGSNKHSPTPSSTKAVTVPKGSVQLGQFFYPKQHPSFFDQPMFAPRTVRGTSFQLRQVLGSFRDAEDDAATKNNNDNPSFERADFYNKTFFLTSQPIPQREPPKGQQRWSIKYNKYVRDDIKQAPKDQDSAEEEEMASHLASLIRVMQITFFPNNTFASTRGLNSGGGSGDATDPATADNDDDDDSTAVSDETILRGKYDVIGDNRDQFWMQVVRFGFGRSVSGSVYSEGRMLGPDDEKAYWGTIKYEAEEEDAVVGKTHNSNSSNKNDTATAAAAAAVPERSSTNTTASIAAEEGQQQQEPSPPPDNDDDKERRRIEVKGTVMLGWGLEPQPVASFILREQVDTDDDEVDDHMMDDDDDDDDETRTIQECRDRLMLLEKTQETTKKENDPSMMTKDIVSTSSSDDDDATSASASLKDEGENETGDDDDDLFDGIDWSGTDHGGGFQ